MNNLRSRILRVMTLSAIMLTCRCSSVEAIAGRADCPTAPWHAPLAPPNKGGRHALSTDSTNWCDSLYMKIRWYEGPPQQMWQQAYDTGKKFISSCPNRSEE